jgi:hypothetical protein
MPIISGWRDNEGIIWPKDYGRWDDLGNGSGSYFTITSVGGVALTYGDGLNGTGAAEFPSDNSGYWRIDYTDALNLLTTKRPNWTIDFYIRIDSDSTSTTNFQTAHEGVIFAKNVNGLLIDDGSSLTVDYAGTIDANRKFKFYWKDGSTLTSYTSTATIGVDEWTDIKIVNEGSDVEIYINGVLDTSFTVTGSNNNSAGPESGIAIGGNANGDYLLSAKVDAFRIRKDAFYTPNPHDQGLGVSSDSHLIDESNGWDINTLIILAFNEGEGSTAPKPRQNKLIPQTWGDWTYWWINPYRHISVITSDINFNTPITGFKNVDIVTTDGFLCAYGFGSSALSGSGVFRAWKPSATSSHMLTTDLNPVTQLKDDGPYGSGLITTTSTNYYLKLPGAGYIPEEQITESQSMLDETKVDSFAAASQFNQGMRPRGILQMTYFIDQTLAEQELETNDDQDRRFYMGLPYYEISDSASTAYEGGLYSFKNTAGLTESVAPTLRYDHDFRLGNSNTRLIEDIDDNSSSGAGVIITTRTAHGLSDGDKIMVRPGLFRNLGTYPNTTGTVEPFEAHKLHGISYVRVRSTTEVELFADSGLSNPVDTGTTATLSWHTPGYIITPNNSGVPYIKDLGHKLANWTSPFADIKEITSNREVVYKPSIERTGELAFSGGSPSSFGLPSIRQAEQTVQEYFGTASDTIQYKTIPKGDVNDPIEITTFNTGAVGPQFHGAPIFVDLDLPTNGTLYVNISDIERADSSTETPPRIRAYYGLNGHSPTAGTDDTLTSFTLDSADTVSFAIGADSEMASDELRSIQLWAAIDGVTHALSSDVTRAKWRIWFVSDVSEADNRIFWAGGMPPGFNRLTSGPRATAMTSADYISRARSSMVYTSTGDNSQFRISGIPLVANSLLGETYISGGGFDEIFRIGASGNPQHYDLAIVDETISKTNGGTGTTDIAPWVRFATQTEDQYRLHNRRRWRCLESHTSSRDFDTDVKLGRWQLV